MNRKRTRVGVFTPTLIAAGVALAYALGLFAPLKETVDRKTEAAHESQDSSAMPGMDMGDMAMARGMTAAAESKVSGHAVVTIPIDQQQLIGVRIGKVERDELRMSIRAVGVIEPDQRRLARIQTRVRGWVTKLHVDFVGAHVKKGEPLLDIYSPELFAAQNELLVAAASQGSQAGSINGLAELSRRRLELMGVAPQEIAELERTRQPQNTLVLRSPIDGTVLNRLVLDGTYVEPQTELYRVADLSTVWLQAKVYEYELPHIEVGQSVQVTLQAEPEKIRQGKVAFVEPTVQEATRTIRVRVEIDNGDEKLKPGMYADLQVEHDMGTGLLVPESAVMRTGERALCFRALPEGRFEPVEVRLGNRFGDRFELLSGLAEGDAVVVSAGFLLDSESRLKATTSGNSVHQHGS